MAEFLSIGENWLNVDKITRAENTGTAAEPIVTVHFQGGDKKTFDVGEEARRVLAFLKKHKIAD